VTQTEEVQHENEVLAVRKLQYHTYPIRRYGVMQTPFSMLDEGAESPEWFREAVALPETVTTPSHIPTEQQAQSDTEQRIEEIRARLAAATKGEWFVSEAEEEETAVSVYVFSDDDSLLQYASHHEWKCENGCYEDSDREAEREQYAEAINTAYCLANAPSDIAYLLDQVSSIPAQ